jgi:hypothetical protein
VTPAAKANLMLAQFAQLHQSGTVNIMGGGLTVVSHQVGVMFIAGTLQFGWEGVGQDHTMLFELVEHPDGEPILGPGGDPVAVKFEFPINPGPGVPWGTPLTLPLAIPVASLPLQPGTEYAWRYSFDGEAGEDWSIRFLTVPAQAGQPT